MSSCLEIPDSRTEITSTSVNPRWIFWIQRQYRIERAIHRTKQYSRFQIPNPNGSIFTRGDDNRAIIQFCNYNRSDRSCVASQHFLHGLRRQLGLRLLPRTDAAEDLARHFGEWERGGGQLRCSG